MCVQNLVPIGPQATTCIPLEGYTHRQTDRHTHTLLYRYRFWHVFWCYSVNQDQHLFYNNDKFAALRFLFTSFLARKVCKICRFWRAL